MQNLIKGIFAENTNAYLFISQLLIIFILVVPQTSFVQENSDVQIWEQTQSNLWRNLLSHDPAWYKSKEALQIAKNILIYQRASGGWPKNIELGRPLSETTRKRLAKYPDKPYATIDNGATYTQLYFLSKMFNITHDEKFRTAFIKGFDYLLASQYPNGGWPQFYPLRKGYYSHITFNDDAMIGVMRLLRDVGKNKSDFHFVDEDRRTKAQNAIEKGIDCILKTQIKVKDQLTAWCAQYDEITLKPAKARAYELASLSGKESVAIIQLLMEIENPSPKVIQAVQSAVAWLEQVKILGIRVVEQPDTRSASGFDRIVIADSAAPPIWARFYLIDSNKPFFSDRDGKIYYHLSEISSERRNEYGWLGYWPEKLLERYYPKWQQKWAPEKNVLCE
ncbi:pectate lyase [candidate division KSB1 bacterium]|nr:pectate lyase [candidate division KSB1 bacterium]